MACKKLIWQRRAAFSVKSGAVLASPHLGGFIRSLYYFVLGNVVEIGKHPLNYQTLRGIQQ